MISKFKLLNMEAKIQQFDAALARHKRNLIVAVQKNLIPSLDSFNKKQKRKFEGLLDQTSIYVHYSIGDTKGHWCIYSLGKYKSLREIKYCYNGISYMIFNDFPLVPKVEVVDIEKDCGRFYLKTIDDKDYQELTFDKIDIVYGHYVPKYQFGKNYKNEDKSEIDLNLFRLKRMKEDIAMIHESSSMKHNLSFFVDHEYSNSHKRVYTVEISNNITKYFWPGSESTIFDAIRRCVYRDRSIKINNVNVFVRNEHDISKSSIMKKFKHIEIL